MTTLSVPSLASDGQTEFRITGMTCQGCARNATNAIQSVAAVDSATVELAAGRAAVRWKAGAAPAPNAVVAAIQKAGFRAQFLGEPGAAAAAAPSPWSPLSGWQFNVVVGGAITLLLMVGEWGLQLGNVGWYRWLSFALALPVQLLCGARFYRGAWNQLRVGRSNMDTLVALGSTTAFAYSLWALLAAGTRHLYFMEAVAIISLISIGHWLESKVSARAADALKSLLQLAPTTARWLSAGGVETEVPVANLAEGDRVLLKPGDRVPVDGEVLEGDSAVDESMLTGESLPVEKSVGTSLYAGTVNQNGRLVMRVTATGQATALANIIAVVQRAQSSRADIQKLGDRVSSVFVPVVALVALASGLWWGLAYTSATNVAHSLMPYLWTVTIPATALAAAFIHAAAVLIVACPCAMGLATPAAIMAGANVAARHGILVRDGTALEKSGRVTAIVFDKTGTLTQGKVAVAASEDLRAPEARRPSLESLAAALAKSSSHPLSRAVAARAASGSASDPAIEFAEWQEVRGSGLLASRDGARWRLGSLTWLEAEGVNVTAGNGFVEQWAARGATLLGLASDRQLVGLLALRDELKPRAAEVVRRIQSNSHAVFLLTGDRRETAVAVANQAGIPAEHVFAEVRPEQKAERIRQLQQEGRRVAFVGDGINDAPALEQADLGIAVSRASDVAREAADLILLRSDIEAIPEALGLAQAALRTIKQNLFWAFIYNIAAVPLAALGFLSPILSAAAMGCSDLIVIGNALRLRRWRMRK